MVSVKRFAAATQSLEVRRGTAREYAAERGWVEQSVHNVMEIIRPAVVGKRGRANIIDFETADTLLKRAGRTVTSRRTRSAKTCLRCRKTFPSSGDFICPPCTIKNGRINDRLV